MIKCREQHAEMVGWAEFLPDVRPYVPGAPDDLIEHTIRAVSIEFCKRTKVLRRLYYADLYKGVEDYFIEPSDGYIVDVLMHASASGRALPPLQRYPASGRACGVYFDRPSTIYVFPPPARDEPDGLELELALFPSQYSCSIEKSFFEDHAEEIGIGARAQLLMMPNVDWEDQRLGLRYSRWFKDAIIRTKVRLAKGNQAGPLIMRARRAWY